MKKMYIKKIIMRLEITQKIKKIKKTSFLTRINRGQGSRSYLLLNKALEYTQRHLYHLNYNILFWVEIGKNLQWERIELPSLLYLIQIFARNLGGLHLI